MVRVLSLSRYGPVVSGNSRVGIEDYILLHQSPSAT